jgi:hypothetical protein
MPATYSINVGQITESYRKPDIFSVIQDLPNNTQKLISPKDVRDAFLSTWANSSFKLTSGETFSSIEYIGLDSGNPEDRDIKKRILLGKRSFGNLDIMNTTLLNNNSADIFLYNTKVDGDPQESTKVAILAGTNSILHLSAPYIEGYATGSSIDLNIINPSSFGGDINIFSSTGRVAINGIVFPTATETSASASNGKILRYFGTYPFGSLQWDDSTVTISDIGEPGSPTNIYGSPVLLNGYSLEFSDSSLVPVDIGGITQGTSFETNTFYNTFLGTYSDYPLSEIIRKILYPYIEPVLSLSVTNPLTGNTYAEAGTTPSLQFDWSITTYARDNNEDISDFFFSENTPLPGTTRFEYGSSFSNVPGSVTSSTFNYVTYSSGGTMEFSLYVSTVPGVTSFGFPFGYSFSTTDYINWINPIFYGFSNIIATASPVTNKNLTDGISKLVEPYKGISQSYFVPYNGSGYLYFIHPTSFFTDIQYIKDPNGFLIYEYTSPTFSIFTHSNYNHPDYTGQFEFWRTTGTVSYNGTGEFEFIF